jgi:hypothetical protein
MLCTSCGTRISERDRHCPNCGKALRNGGLGGGADFSTGRGSEATHPPLSKSTAMAEPEPPDPGETVGRTSARSDTKPLPAASPKSGTPPRRATPTDVSLTPPPAEIRALIADRPDLIEPGLRLYREDGGKTLGAGYPSDVGTIDLLARDDGGGFVVVLVADRDQAKEVVGEMLQRVGWVRKHLAHKHQEVRGIVLMGHVPEEIGYAAAAVADTIAFKTYRMAITLESVEI